MASHSLYLVHVLHVPCRITASPTVTTSQTSTLWALHLRRPTVTLDSATRRTARGSFAYRHTSERISQHYCIRRANLCTLLITNKLIYVFHFKLMANLVLVSTVVFQCLIATFLVDFAQGHVQTEDFLNNSQGVNKWQSYQHSNS
jgi:hypothetical protein